MLRAVAFVWLLVVLAGLVCPPVAPAQPQETKRDTTYAGSASLDSLEVKLSRRRWSRWLSDYVFIRRADTDSAEVMATAVVESESQYMPFAGRFIRTLHITQLPLFSAKSGGTGGALGVLNKVHIDTRERVIRGYFLMSEGDPLDPFVLADTERLLRSTPFIQDATIQVVPVTESPDSVDLLVVTQDVWSIGATGSVRGVGKYRVKLFERNFLGLGHIIEAEFDVSRGRSQEVNFLGLYRIENIGGTFIDGEIRHVDSHIENRPQLVFSRPFRTVEIKYGGALELARTEEKNDAGDIAKSLDTWDLWVGRAFRTREAFADDKDRTQFTVSGRIAARD